MGWLFGSKKKVPKVPFPEGMPIDKKQLDFNSLRFPKKITSKENIIEPEGIKAAAGLSKEGIELPVIGEDFETEMPTKVKSAFDKKPRLPTPFFAGSNEPLYVKLGIYQRLLGELNSLKSNINKLKEVNHHLSTSEYNEENNFKKLKRSVKNIHDRLLEMDKIIFKTQGE